MHVQAYLYNIYIHVYVHFTYPTYYLKTLRLLHQQKIVQLIFLLYKKKHMFIPPPERNIEQCASKMAPCSCVSNQNVT